MPNIFDGKIEMKWEKYTFLRNKGWHLFKIQQVIHKAWEVISTKEVWIKTEFEEIKCFYLKPGKVPTAKARMKMGSERNKNWLMANQTSMDEMVRIKHLNNVTFFTDISRE